MISKLFSSKLKPLELAKVIQVSNDLGINTNFLLAVIYFETSKTMSPQIRNSIGAVGLIQFVEDFKGAKYKTINGKRYEISHIANMNFIEQMKLVQEYYTEIIRLTKSVPQSFIDCYFVTFFPNAIGKSDDYILQTKTLSALKIAQQNSFFQKNGRVTKKNVIDAMLKFYPVSEHEFLKKKIIL